MTAEDRLPQRQIDRPPAWAYAWWVVAGALAGLGIAALLTAGIFVLPLAIILVAVGIYLPALRNTSAAAALAGLAAPVVYVAWLNRGGPGDVCTTHADGSVECFDAWSPWPFLAVAVLFVATSIGLARLLRPSVS